MAPSKWLLFPTDLPRLPVWISIDDFNTNRRFAMKKLLFLSMVACMMLIGVQSAKAQYDWGIGARLGPWLGLTVKKNLNANGAIEGIFDSRFDGFQATGLYEYHIPIEKVDGLRFYFGGGIHLGYWYKAYSSHPRWGNRDRGMFWGPDLILGIEYTFDSFPLNISADYKPGYYLWRGYRGPSVDNGALSLRYVF